ncbi:hypothetical protein R3P38DRAFT_2790647 [Favolaschia claudopus]|uniref:Uncharacterized protein n=1 Tax=Favolaschia claudopus TaxID=2862362 RepID=A0AAW0AI12_9AGAR
MPVSKGRKEHARNLTRQKQEARERQAHDSPVTPRKQLLLERMAALEHRMATMESENSSLKENNEALVSRADELARRLHKLFERGYERRQGGGLTLEGTGNAIDGCNITANTRFMSALARYVPLRQCLRTRSDLRIQRLAALILSHNPRLLEEIRIVVVSKTVIEALSQAADKRDETEDLNVLFTAIYRLLAQRAASDAAALASLRSLKTQMWLEGEFPTVRFSRDDSS